MKARIVALALLAAAALPAVAAELVPFSAVVVNGQSIPAERIRIEIDAARHATAALHGGGAAGQREPGKVALDMAVDHLVVRELLIQEARARGYAVAEDELAAAWEAEQKRWGSPELFTKSLQLRGLTADFLRDRIAEDLLTRKLVREAVDTKIPASESETIAEERKTELFSALVRDLKNKARIEYLP